MVTGRLSDRYPGVIGELMQDLSGHSALRVRMSREKNSERDLPSLE